MIRFNCGTIRASPIGNAIFQICRFVISTCKLSAISSLTKLILIPIWTSTHGSLFFVYVFAEICRNELYFAENHRLNTLFDIQSEESTSEVKALILEIGPDYCAYAFLDADKRSFTAVKYFSFEEPDAEESIRRIIGEIGHHAQNTIVCSAFPYAILMPLKQFKNDYSLIDRVYEQPAQHYLNDSIAEWQMTNIYSLPSSIQALVNQLPNVKYYHVYTPSLKVYNGFTAGSQVSVHLTTQHFRVLVRKDGTIQLVQTYFYKTPLDVVYYLLKIFSEFSLDQNETYVILSGLVEEDSAMYKELYAYFTNLHFAQPPAISLPANDHPHHFFTSLYNVAACAL